MTAHLDGNALAGPLSGLFSTDLTTAVFVCAGCGRSDVVATVTVYGAPMGMIARCPGCEAVLLRYVETAGGRTFEMRGVATLRIAPDE